MLLQHCKFPSHYFFLLSTRVKNIYLKWKKLVFHYLIFCSWIIKAFLIIYLYTRATEQKALYIFRHRDRRYFRRTNSAIHEERAYSLRSYCLVWPYDKGHLHGDIGLLHARHDPKPAISHRLFRAVLILSPIGGAARMLSVPELILAATIGNKFVLDSPRSFFSYTEVVRTARRSNLWHLQLANCTRSEKLIVWSIVLHLLMFPHHLHTSSWAFLSIITSAMSWK